MKKQQSGFTLIELIMVIVILGILSAFALPRFADLSGQAEAASRDALEGALRSGNGIAHAVCLATADCDASAATSEITLEGQDVDMVFGYPAATAAGIGTAVDISGYTFDYTTTPPSITIATGCTVTYTAATSATAPSSVGGDDANCP